MKTAEHFAQAFKHILGVKENQQPWQQSRHDEEQKRSGSKSSEVEIPHKSAYEILGVSVGASLEEIVAAYHHMAKMYHPDRLAHLEPEFVALAEERMKEINAAYEELKRQA